MNKNRADKLKMYGDLLTQSAFRDNSPCAVFARRIANMTTEEEMADGGTSEDFIDTLNALIRDARELTGIDPGHEKLYCNECHCDIDDCDCDTARPDALEVHKEATE